MSDLNLTVSPQVVQLLIDIKSSLQRLEAQVREATLRLAWARAATAAETPSVRVGLDLAAGKDCSVAVPADYRPAPPQAKRPPSGRGSVHTPKGYAAARRMSALREILGLSQTAMARELGVSQMIVWAIETKRNGISHRVNEAMLKLEGKG